MPDRGKERDGTDGIMLQSSLLLCRQQTAAACGHTGDRVLAMLPSLTCSRGGLPRLLPWVLGIFAESYVGDVDTLKLAGPRQAGSEASLRCWPPDAGLLATLQGLWPAGGC